MNYTGTFFRDIANLLYPHLCAGCGTDVLSDNAVICSRCFSELPETGFHLHRENPVEKIFRGRIPLVSATSHVYFTKQSSVQNLLHRLKYKGDQQVGAFLGKLLGRELKKCDWLHDLHAIIPLPLHYTRQRRRGYNQAELISDGIAGELNVAVFSDIVVRTKKTHTQTNKSRMDRWGNIEQKFEVINGDRVADRHILLVDDVLTTGATLESCGAELLKCAGTRLSIATFAYTSL